MLACRLRRAAFDVADGRDNQAMGPGHVQPEMEVVGLRPLARFAFPWGGLALHLQAREQVQADDTDKSVIALHHHEDIFAAPLHTTVCRLDQLVPEGLP